MKTSLSTPNCTVTEVIATQRFVDNLLLTNKNNRTISRHRVEQLVRDLRAGTWTFNGATIVLDGNGALMDGQHRLTAIREAGYPAIPLLVVRLRDSAEQAEPAFLTMDTGRTRSYSDNLTHAGVKNAHMFGAVCRQLFASQSGSWNPTRAELESVRERYGKEIERILSVRYVTGMIEFQAAYYAGFVAAAHATGRVEDVAAFAELVRSGEGLVRGSNAYNLFARVNAAARLHITRPLQMENFGRTVRITLAELAGRTYKATGIVNPYGTAEIKELLERTATAA